MRIAAAVAGLATAGAGGGYVVARLRPSGRERLWRSLRRR
jgi:hypothetical protein